MRFGLYMHAIATVFRVVILLTEFFFLVIKLQMRMICRSISLMWVV